MAERDDAEASGKASEQSRSITLALLGFAAGTASTVFMDKGAFSIWAAPLGGIIFLSSLYYEPDIPRSGPGAWAFALIVAVGLVMIVGWFVNTLLGDAEGSKNYAQLVLTVAFAGAAMWYRNQRRD
ncbi:MAG: hypothetical protein ACFBWO_14465 [Paracoccaceae bacterium]